MHKCCVIQSENPKNTTFYTHITHFRQLKRIIVNLDNVESRTHKNKRGDTENPKE
tara:strand:- start:870 stop:1034 length:165 start_codon:yes stop_codon:yes gene_type:complete